MFSHQLWIITYVTTHALLGLFRLIGFAFPSFDGAGAVSGFILGVSSFSTLPIPLDQHFAYTQGFFVAQHHYHWVFDPCVTIQAMDRMVAIRKLSSPDVVAVSVADHMLTLLSPCSSILSTTRLKQHLETSSRVLNWHV